jgi:chromosome partitioning protein
MTATALEGWEARITDPYVIVVINQKGGVGKSLLALALAAITADQNGAAYLIDTDDQGTAQEVNERAERNGTPLPFSYDLQTDRTELAKLRKVRGVDMVFVDTAGRLGGPAMTEILQAADFAVIPYVHDSFVVGPTLRTAEVCRAAGVPFRVLINMVDPSRGTGPLEDARETLDGLKLPRFGCAVRKYVAHSQAHTEGLMITSYRGDNAVKAQTDVRRVHGEMLMHLRRAA